MNMCTAISLLAFGCKGEKRHGINIIIIRHHWKSLEKMISDTDKKLRMLTSNVRMHFAHWLAANVNHFVAHHAYNKDVY